MALVWKFVLVTLVEELSFTPMWKHCIASLILMQMPHGAALTLMQTLCTATLSIVWALRSATLAHNTALLNMLVL